MLAFKGRNTINMDADSNANSSNEGILLLNNGEKWENIVLFPKKARR